MLDFLLDLSFWSGLMLVSSSIFIAGLLVTTLAKRILNPYILKQHERIGRLLFRVTAGLIALLLSLSYANERVGQSRVIESLNQEASHIVQLVVSLNQLKHPEAERIRDHLFKYVELTIEDEWNSVNADPFFSEAANELKEAYTLMIKLEVKDEQEQRLKITMIDAFNEIIHMMQVRIYSEVARVPYLMYILFIGMVFMWIFFTVYVHDRVSLLFLSLYNLMIGVLIYFVFTLSNPLIGPLKIKANSFEIIRTMAIEKFEAETAEPTTEPKN